MENKPKYTYWDAIMSFDDNWHIVNYNEYNSKGKISEQYIFARCGNEDDAKKIVEALNKFDNE